MFFFLTTVLCVNVSKITDNHITVLNIGICSASVNVSIINQGTSSHWWVKSSVNTKQWQFKTNQRYSTKIFFLCHIVQTCCPACSAFLQTKSTGCTLLLLQSLIVWQNRAVFVAMAFCHASGSQSCSLFSIVSGWHVGTAYTIVTGYTDKLYLLHQGNIQHSRQQTTCHLSVCSKCVFHVTV